MKEESEQIEKEIRTKEKQLREKKVQLDKLLGETKPLEPGEDVRPVNSDEWKKAHNEVDKLRKELQKLRDERNKRKRQNR